MANQLNLHDRDAHDAATDDGRRPSRRLIAGGITLLAALIAFTALRYPFGRGTRAPVPSSFNFDLGAQLRTDAQQGAYVQRGTFPLALEQPKALASGPDDRIYVLGDQAIHVFAADGVRQEVVRLEGDPTCLAVAPTDHTDPNRLYVATTGGIDVLAASRKFVAHWPLPNERAIFTSLAVAPADVFVADAGNRVIWRYSASGETLGQIGAPDAARNIPGFVVPSPHFDIAVGSEGLLYGVNPGKLQIAAFTFEGDLGTSWGQGSSLVSDFFGCCNPAHLALMSDGRFVTSEKGIPRIKVYSTTGRFEALVAGPEQLGIDERSVGDPRLMSAERVFDIAVDHLDRILVLDSMNHLVRIFTAGQPSQPTVRILDAGELRR